MYYNFVFNNINQALPKLMDMVLENGEENGSRNGAVKELTHIGITLESPQRREILTPERKVNLAAQIAETMWVLAGRNDVEFLSHYLPRAADFSDDGQTWRAGYGPRLRAWNKYEFYTQGEHHLAEPIDQLAEVVRLLREDPMSRRAVMSIFDPAVDYADSKDIPCNNWISFSNRLGYLDMHVAIRSNDLMWGWSGINAFEWSVIQEIVAGMVGVKVGSIHFSTTNLHLYAPYWDKAQRIAERLGGDVPGLLDESDLEVSPRFLAAMASDVEELDGLIRRWFLLEEKIRTGGIDSYLIDAFPEPMMKSWLRVLQWWWTGNHKHLQPLAGTRLEYATHMAMQPPSRKAAVTPEVITVEPQKVAEIQKVSGYTRHGHAIEGVVQVGKPNTVARCGGPGLCLICQRDIVQTQAVQELRVEGTPSAFMQFAIHTHNEKHRAYGDSWKRRGEMLGIMANIARKVDRLGGAETSDETSADTAMDLMVYLAKYRAWLDPAAKATSEDQDHGGNAWLRWADRTPYIGVLMPSQKDQEQRLREQFDELEKAVVKSLNRVEIVEAMLVNAYRLARYLWETSAPGDDYRGADAD